MKLKTLFILFFSLFSLVFIQAQETIVDTIFAAGPPLTGEISNFNYNYELQVDFLALIMGDTGVPWIPPEVPNAVFKIRTQYFGKIPKKQSQIKCSNFYSL